MCKTCSVDNCNNKHYSKGYCKKHYQQLKRYGHVLERTTHDKNEMIDCGDYAEMILYNNKGEEVARTLIDLECIDLVKKYKWYLTNHGYVINDKVGQLHRLLMNPGEDLVVDHINRDRLDNRRENLRICTIQQNSMNKSVQCNNISGTQGVCWCKDNKIWLAYIGINGKRIHLGCFKTKKEAVEARRLAEIEYFGEFAPNN